MLVDKIMQVLRFLLNFFVLSGTKLILILAQKDITVTCKRHVDYIFKAEIPETVLSMDKSCILMALGGFKAPC